MALAGKRYSRLTFFLKYNFKVGWLKQVRIEAVNSQVGKQIGVHGARPVFYQVRATHLCRPVRLTFPGIMKMIARGALSAVAVSAFCRRLDMALEPTGRQAAPKRLLQTLAATVR